MNMVEKIVVSLFVIVLLLNVGFVLGSSASTDIINFGVTYDNVTCVVINDADDVALFAEFGEVEINHAYWQDPNSGSLDDTQDNCYDAEGFDFNGAPLLNALDGCCPAPNTCDVEDTNSDGIGDSGSEFCVWTPAALGGCQGFIEADCNGNSIIAGNYLDPILEEEGFLDGCYWYNISENGNCKEIIQCSCSWNASANDGAGLCQPRSEHKIQDYTSSTTTRIWNMDDIDSDILAFCEIGDITGRCEGQMTTFGNCSLGDDNVRLEWAADWTGVVALRPTYCHATTQIVSCENVVRLGFFSLLNMVIVVLVLIVVYYFYSKKKVKKVKKK
jgi:hypothetical protein